MKFTFAAALAAFTLSAGAAGQSTVRVASSEGAIDDLFAQAIVDSSSLVMNGFSVQDAFGSVTPSAPYIESLAGGHVLFDNSVTTSFIDFHTAEPVMIGGFNIYLSSDGVANAFRGFNSAALYTSTNAGLTFDTLLGQTSYDPAMGPVAFSGLFSPVTAQYFRFEAFTPYGGGRVIEIDALPAIPEPVTWAMMIAGFGAIGGAMRRRNKMALA